MTNEKKDMKKNTKDSKKVDITDKEKRQRKPIPNTHAFQKNGS